MNPHYMRRLVRLQTHETMAEFDRVAAGFDGISTELDALTADSTPAAILAKLLTVDGAGSGLAADGLDVMDDRDNTTVPADMVNRGIVADFKRAAYTPGTDTHTYGGQLTFAPWQDDSGGDVHALLFGGNGKFERVHGTRAGGWGPAIELADTANRGIVKESGVLSTGVPPGGVYSGGTSAMSGGIVLSVPGATWNSTMLAIQVDVYDFKQNGSFSIMLAGYNYAGTSAWLNTSAQLSGRPKVGRNLRVRFGTNGSGEPVIQIGEAGDTWDFPIVRVRDLMCGWLGATQSAWKQPWSVALSATTIPTVHKTHILNLDLVVPTLTGGWSIFSALYPPSYSLIDGIVYLHGVISGGTISSAAFTLPAGCRPAQTAGFSTAVAIGTNEGFIQVSPAGTVTPLAGSTTYMALDGVSFPAARL